MINYKILNNYVLFENKVIVVYQLEPLDLVILPEQEQQSFEADMVRMLNSIQEGSIQIIMQTRKAVPNDFENHFSNLRETQNRADNASSGNIKNRLIIEYLGHLNDLLLNNIIPIKEYFLIFSHSTNTNMINDLNKNIILLNHQVERVSINFKRAGIKLSLLEGNLLNRLFSNLTRV